MWPAIVWGKNVMHGQGILKLAGGKKTKKLCIRWRDVFDLVDIIQDYLVTSKKHKCPDFRATLQVHCLKCNINLNCTKNRSAHASPETHWFLDVTVSVFFSCRHPESGPLMDIRLLVGWWGGGGVAYLDWGDVHCLRLQRPPLFLFTWSPLGWRLSWKAQSEPVKGSVAQSWPWRSTHCVVQRCNEALCGYWYDRTKGQGAVRTAIHTFHTICFSHRIHHINGSPFCDSSWLPAYPWREKGVREGEGGRERDRKPASEREREGEREREIGRKIGSEGAPVLRVKGESGLEGGSGIGGGWEPAAIFFILSWRLAPALSSSPQSEFMTGQLSM